MKLKILKNTKKWKNYKKCWSNTEQKPFLKKVQRKGVPNLLETCPTEKQKVAFSKPKNLRQLNSRANFT